jgi:hypothetical protein
MQSDFFQFMQFVAALVFLGILAAGIYILKNYDRLFGPDADVPSETGSSRAYFKMQVLVVWLHAAALTGAMALMLH